MTSIIRIAARGSSAPKRTDFERQILTQARQAHVGDWVPWVTSILDADIPGCELAMHSGMLIRRRLGPRGLTSLHIASVSSHADADRVISWLVDHGSQLESDEQMAYRPLHLAILHGRPDLARQLVGLGADPNSPGLDGCTALDCALETEGCVDMAAWLILHGAHLDRIDWRDAERTTKLLGQVQPRLVSDSRMRTACMDILVDAMTSNGPAAAWATSVIAEMGSP